MRVVHWLALLLGTLAALGASDLDLPVRKPTRLEPSPSVAPQPPWRLTPPPESPRPVVLFGSEVQVTDRVAYVLDYSQSMGVERWTRLKREFALSVRNLPPRVEFMATLYGCAVFPFSDEWSTDAEGAIAWLESQGYPWQTKNATGTAQAVLYAIQSGARHIFVVTDGMPGGCGLAPRGHDPRPIHLRVVREANKDGASISVWCLQGDQLAQRFCVALAAENSGQYSYVP